jgi:general secretion pathway protein G
VTKSFSLLELIFAIVIISTLASFAIPKLFYNIDKANIIKLKADVALIRDSINKFHNQQILANTNMKLENLDNGIIPSSNWSKISENRYKAWINTNISVEFIYNPNDLTFDCNFDEEYCKELTQ